MVLHGSVWQQRAVKGHRKTTSSGPQNWILDKYMKNKTHNLSLMLLVLIPIGLYLQATQFDFVDFDDFQYVTLNENVTSGISLNNIAWAFRSLYASNWHPLTWISHMLDVQVFGMNPAGHHLTNILLHTANTLLLFLVLKRMTGAHWQSMAVAVFFAIHPLHVESVAFVAERKDVLSTLFWLLTMLAYLSYVRNPAIISYVFVILLYAMGLMSKPMLVSLPIILLLLDYWPLGRWQQHEGDVSQPLYFWRLVLEKLPLFAMAAASCIITVVAQDSGGSLGSLAFSSLLLNLATALVAYANYLSKMIWPVGLAAFYPLQENIPWWQITGSIMLLLSVSFVCIHEIRKRPYLAVGWLWYLISIFPVIGIVHVGKQAMADRYTYIPLIGIFIMLAWEAGRISERWRFRRPVLITVSMSIVAALSLLTWHQIGYWKDGITLFEHVVKTTAPNSLSRTNLGVALMNKSRYGEAIQQLNSALMADPSSKSAYYNLGLIYYKLGNFPAAIEALNEVIRIDPTYKRALSKRDDAYNFLRPRDSEAKDQKSIYLTTEEKMK